MASWKQDCSDREPLRQIGSRSDVACALKASQLEALGGRVTAFSTVVVAILGTWLVIDVEAFDSEQAWLSASYVPSSIAPARRSSTSLASHGVPGARR